MRNINKIITDTLASLFALTSIAYAAAYLPVVGGTGTSTPPQYGQVLVGNNQGTYDVVATSTLGITSPNYWTLTGSNLYNNVGTNVGIGTSNPTAPFQINTGAYSAPLRVMNMAGVSGDSSTGIQFTDYNGAKPYYQYVDNAGIFHLYGTAGQSATFFNTQGRSVFTSDQVIVGAGSSYIPALTLGTGSNQTGLYAPATDVIGFLNNGSENMRIAANGNVGIGSTTPGSLLSIGDVDGINFNAGATATSTFGGNVSILGSLNFNGLLLQNGAPFAGSQWTTSGSNIYYNTGNVGIGTSTPDQNLSVKSAIDILSDGTASGGSTNVPFDFSVTADPFNSFTDALIIAPHDSSQHRIFFGDASHPALLEMNYVTSVQNMPGFSTRTDVSDWGFDGPFSVFRDSVNDIETFVGSSPFGQHGGFAWYASSTAFVDVATGAAMRMRLTGDGFLGLGSTTPSAQLSVQTNSTTTNIFSFATSTAQTLFYADPKGNQYVGGDMPTLSSCGTTPSVGAGSNNTAMRITTGSGLGLASCTIIFADGGYTATGRNPICNGNFESTTVGSLKFLSTQTTLTVSVLSGATFPGGTFNAHCIGI